jgi:hypothetical protein
LVSWASGNTERFWAFVASKLAKDFGEQPYPLTAACSRVTRDGIEEGRWQEPGA